MSDSLSAVAAPDQALLLRTREFMQYSERSVVSGGVVAAPENNEGFAVRFPTLGSPSEDLYESNQLVFRFDANCLGKAGKLVLELEIPPSNLRDNVRRLVVQNVRLRADDRIEAHLSLLDSDLLREAELQFRWGYSKHAGMRRVCEPVFDAPGDSIWKWTYHLNYLGMQSRPLEFFAATVGFRDAIVELSQTEMQEINDIDACEAVLDELDKRFAVADNYLCWKVDEVTERSLGEMLKSLRQEVNVIFRCDEQEWIYGKRVKPVVEFLVGLGGSESFTPAWIGISNV